MKKALSWFLTLLFVLGAAGAYADTLSLDLESATVDELNAAVATLQERIAEIEKGETFFFDTSSSDGSYEDGLDDFGEFVAKSYVWERNDRGYAAIILENTTQDDLLAEISVIFRSKDGSMVGVKNAEVDAIDGGEKSIAVVYNDTPFDHIDYEITAKNVKYYVGILDDLNAETVQNDKKVIVSVKNDGSIPAKYVKAYVLFINKGEVVDYDYTYVTDSDNEIKPGKTAMKEVSTRDKFDSFEVYFEGVGDK